MDHYLIGFLSEKNWDQHYLMLKTTNRVSCIKIIGFSNNNKKLSKVYAFFAFFLLDSIFSILGNNLLKEIKNILISLSLNYLFQIPRVLRIF